MSAVIGIRRETKGPWERRVALTPRRLGRLISEHDLEVRVQPCPRRVFSDADFVRVGARLTPDLEPAKVVFGVKEIPPDALHADTVYVFFAHVIKGQAVNMPMLRRLLELGCTLIDYERITDAAGRRLIFFGRFAGLAGMIDSLWTLGQRLRREGIDTPFTSILPAHAYPDLESARDAVAAAGREIANTGLPPELRPLVIGVTGYGNVAAGAVEILHELPVHEVQPAELADLAPGNGRRLWRVTFREEDMVEVIEPGAAFELQDYYDHPERYRSRFPGYLPHLTVLINATYWDDRYPRHVTRDALRSLWSGGEKPRLRVIGDLSCDVGGGVECTVRATDPGDPVYVWEPESGNALPGVAGRGPVVLAVDILPAELPVEASRAFSDVLAPLVPAIAEANWDDPFEDLRLPAELKRAVILHRGQLAPDYRYLEAHLAHSG